VSNPALLLGSKPTLADHDSKAASTPRVSLNASGIDPTLCVLPFTTTERCAYAEPHGERRAATVGDAMKTRRVSAPVERATSAPAVLGRVWRRSRESPRPWVVGSGCFARPSAGLAPASRGWNATSTGSPHRHNFLPGETVDESHIPAVAASHGRSRKATSQALVIDCEPSAGCPGPRACALIGKASCAQAPGELLDR